MNDSDPARVPAGRSAVRKPGAVPVVAPTLLVAWALLVGGAPLLLGPPNGDDAYYHAMRAQQHARCWHAGTLLPVWYPDLNAGLGGPEPRAYPLLPLAAHALFAMLAGDGVAATSIATALIPVLAGLVMMAVARRRGAPLVAAAIAGGLWAATPYFVVALHERSALAEAWGLAVLPWVVDALLPSRRDGPLPLLRGAVAFAVLLAVQLPLAAMVAALVGALHLVQVGAGQSLRALQAGLLGLSLSACSWLPNLGSLFRLQGAHLVGPGYRWQDHLVPTLDGLEPALARHLLLASLMVVCAAAVAAIAGRGRERNLAVAALVATVLASEAARWLYGWLPGAGFLQFPWRWIGPASCLTLLALAALSDWRPRLIGHAVLLLAVSPAGALDSRLPPGPPLRPSDTAKAAAAAATRYGVPPILPSLPAYLPRQADLIQALREAPVVRQALPPPVEAGPQTWRWDLSGPAARAVVLPRLADDGWRACIDGRTTSWRVTRGLVTVDVAAGRHTVVLSQVLLPEQIAGFVITLLAVAGSVALWLRERKAAAVRP